MFIEYKKGNSYSVIDQGYTYLQLLLNNKSDFVLVLSHHLNKVLKTDEINWSGSKIVFEKVLCQPHSRNLFCY